MDSKAISEAVLTVAEEASPSEEEVTTEEADIPTALRILLECHLLRADDASALEAGEAESTGGSLLTEHAGAEHHVAHLVEALDRDEDVSEGITGQERAQILARRRMIRARLEPDVATWSWPILIPHATRSATSWLPEEDATPPCSKRSTLEASRTI